MPYKLDGNCVVKADGSSVPGGCHKTHAQALAHLQALEANVPDAKSAIGKREDVNPAAEKSIKSIKAAYLGDDDSECGDIRNAAGALAQLTLLAESEDDEPEDKAKVVAAMREICNLIMSEIDEYEKEPADEAQDLADRANEMPEGADMAMMNFSYIKALHPDQAEQYFRDVLAVKATGRNEVKGYLALWGDPQHTDIEKEFFTKSTDFWDASLGFPRPLTWNHGQDRDLYKSIDTVGQIQEFGDDDIGRFYYAVLDRSNQYRKAIDKLISRKSIGTSSDSAPQYVIRERVGKSTWLKQWPLFAAALTDVPCEPRMIGSVDYFKALGVAIPADSIPDALRDEVRAAKAKIELLKRLENELRLSI